VLRRVEIKNYRCLRDVDVQLAPLTVFVGPNASGKSALLEALDPMKPVVFEDRWRHTPEYVSFRFTLADGSTQEATLSPSVQGKSQPPWTAVRYQRLHLDLRLMRAENTVARAPQLSPDGDNLANVLATLTRKQQGALAERLCRLVPMFSDVDVQPTAGGRHELRFQDRWNESIWYRPHAVSDGTMLLVAFLVLQYQEAPVDVVAIEEPERALHPYLVDQLVGMLRAMSTGKLGPKPIQVLLATHSAELLEYVEPEEVRFLARRREDGSTEVTQIDTRSPNWQKTFREYRESLGAGSGASAGA
jgi:predicted ATPase